MTKKNKLTYFFFPLLIIILGFSIYANTLKNDFLYDDDTFIVLNPAIRSLNDPLRFLIDRNTTSHNSQMNCDVWRPITTLSYALNYHFSGLNPKTFHFTNIILHLLNGLLIYLLLLLLIKKKSIALMVSLIFIAHPVQTESVAWISQRSNLLFSIFYLSGLILYIKLRKNNNLFCYYLSLIFFSFSLLSKEMAVSFPLVILLYEYLFLTQSVLNNKEKNNRYFSFLFNYGYTIPYFLITAIFVATRYLLLGRLSQTTYWAGGLYPTLLTMSKGFFHYLKLMFIPYPLSVEYLFPVSHSIFEPKVLFSLLILSGLVYTAWKIRKRKPIISFGILFFFINLLPVSNIIPIRTIINERFLYLSTIGFGLVLAVILTNLKNKKLQYAIFFTFIPLILIYSFLTIHRNKTWQNHRTLVIENLKTCPQSATLHYGMGRAYASKGEFDKAIEEFELCLKIDPQYAQALNDLGMIWANRGHTKQVINKYRQSVQKKVDFFEGLHNLGIACFNNGNYKKALKILEKASLLKPGNLEVKNNLACAYAYSGNMKKAINSCIEIIKQDPEIIKTCYNLGLFYQSIGLRKEAQREWDKIINGNLQTLKKENNNLTKFIPKNFPQIKERFTEALQSTHQQIKLDGIEGYRIGKNKYSLIDSFFPQSYGQPIYLSTNEYEIKIIPQIYHNPVNCLSVKTQVEAGIISYHSAYPGTDVLYLATAQGIEEMLFIHSPPVEKTVYPVEKIKPTLSDKEISFSYQLSLKGKANSFFLGKEGNLQILDKKGNLTLILSRPEIIDICGQKRKGFFILKKLPNVKDMFGNIQPSAILHLCFNFDRLKFPILVDPVWKQPTDSTMSSTRDYLTTTLLPNGKILVTGGRNNAAAVLSTCELYDPSMGTWSTTGSMSTTREEHIAVLLPNGKVLVTGGIDGSASLSTAELYNPSLGTWATTNPMSAVRCTHMPTLLPNGKLLVAGGWNMGTNQTVSTCEIYDPSLGTWSTTNSMSTQRMGQNSNILPNGKVLVTGGYISQSTTFLSTCEIYDPALGTWTTTNSMSQGKLEHTTTLLPNGLVLAAGGYLGLFGGSVVTCQLYDPSTGTWSTTSPMSAKRRAHTATLLPNGKLLVSGGHDTDWMGATPHSTCELYTPSGGTWSTTDAMSVARYYHSTISLPNNQVLTVGGYNDSVRHSSCELYDPSSAAWSTSNSLNTERFMHTATLIPNGKVLVTGGNDGTSYFSTCELYDPSAGTWSTTNSMNTTRSQHLPILLANGKVLVSGGYDGTNYFSTCELYDFSAGTWSTTGSMNSNRYTHSAALLGDGKVLVSGGNNGSGPLSTCELYNPSATTWSTTGSLSGLRDTHTTTLLANGQVLITGGDNGSSSLSTCELYNPSATTWSTTGSMSTTKKSHTATLLPNNKVLVTGGIINSAASAVCELYNPTTATWSTTGSLNTAIYEHFALLLPSGKVLVSGGTDGTNYLSNCELYDPASGSWSTTASLNTSRKNHTATLLPNGKILIAGGENSSGALDSCESALYTEYDYTTYASIMQPSISTYPQQVNPNTSYDLTGTRFKAYSQATGGSYCQMNSPTNYPRVYLQFMNSGNYNFTCPSGYFIDVSTSVYPMTNGEWANADTQISFTTPADLPQGYYLLYVLANAIPSEAKIIKYEDSGSTISISISSSGYDFGTVLKNSTNVATSSITVTNNGNVNERYSLNLASPAGWTCVTDTVPGAEEFRMCGNFQTATAQASHFVIAVSSSDAIGTAQSVCSIADFAKDNEGEAAKGYNVPPSEDRYLWFRFESPSSTTQKTQQTITVTITAEQQP